MKTKQAAVKTANKKQAAANVAAEEETATVVTKKVCRFQVGESVWTFGAGQKVKNIPLKTAEHLKKSGEVDIVAVQ